MTDEMIALRALLEKSSDADLLREMIGFTARRLMELEIAERTGADHGERSPDRINWRNGYRERDWETRAGTVELRIPRSRARPLCSDWPPVGADRHYAAAAFNTLLGGVVMRLANGIEIARIKEQFGATAMWYAMVDHRRPRLPIHFVA